MLELYAKIPVASLRVVTTGLPRANEPLLDRVVFAKRNLVVRNSNGQEIYQSVCKSLEEIKHSENVGMVSLQKAEM